jgi:hypothetical protein
MTTVHVTNTWEKPLVVDLAGREVRFPVGETVEIPEAEARHIFGWGKEDRRDNVVFLGLARTANDMPDGLANLEKFQISQEPPATNHSLSPVVEQVPFPTRGRGKVANAN